MKPSEWLWVVHQYYRVSVELLDLEALLQMSNKSVSVHPMLSYLTNDDDIDALSGTGCIFDYVMDLRSFYNRKHVKILM